MATLLIFKVIMPFFILSCVICLILHVDRFQGPERVSILLFILSNLMSTIFFYFLKDDGSWLEIGISISNYVISMLIAVIFFVLFHISNRVYVIRLLDKPIVESSVLKTQ
jgi:phosphatidylinositol glycan class N